MEYQRVIVPIGNQLQRVQQPLAESRLAGAVQIELSHVGRITEQLRFSLHVVRRIRSEGDIVIPRAHLTEEADLPLFVRLSRSPKIYDRPGADVLLEPRNIGSAHGMQRRTSEKPPPCHGAPVARPVSAEVSEIRHGFKIDVSWIRAVHLRSLPTTVTTARPAPPLRSGASRPRNPRPRNDRPLRLDAIPLRPFGQPPAGL